MSECHCKVVLNIGLMVVTYLSLTVMIIDHTRYSGGFFIELVLSDWLGNVRHFIKHKGFNTTFSSSHVVSDVLAR